MAKLYLEITQVKSLMCSKTHSKHKQIGYFQPSSFLTKRIQKTRICILFFNKNYSNN